MTSASADPALMKSVVDRAARDIRTQLTGTYDLNLTAVYAAFHAIQRTTTDAVVLVSDDMVLNNRHAVDLLEPDDYVMLRSVVLERPRFSGTLTATLHSGVEVLLKVTEMGDPPAALFQLRQTGDVPPAIPRSTTATDRVSVLDRAINRVRLEAGSVLVSGEPGSGRTWCAQKITDGHPAEHLDTAELVRQGEAHVVQALDQLLDAAPACLIVDDVDLLPDFAAAHLARVLSQRKTNKVILTMRDHAEPSPQVRYLQAMCGNEVSVPPLRERRDELPGLINELLRREIHTDRVRLTLSAVEALADYSWPGNVTEMVAVLRDVVGKRSVGDITANDLPERFRAQARGRTLSTLQQAERTAIDKALKASRGNKVHAAARLGISRSTLYTRIREYGLS
jgi:transcriptional regulator of acetoin/glycerol metabolism